MPIVHEGLAREFEYVTQEEERATILEQIEAGDALMQEMAYSLITGNHAAVDELTQKALGEDREANDVLDEGLIPGMAVVGVKFRDNLIFVPEVLIAARAMKAGMAHIDPILSASGVEPIGTAVFGTVKGDLHDIGKNLCIMMMRGAGFVVHDLGVDTKPDEFIEAADEKDADLVLMSALLTTTMPNMGRTIAEFEDMGLRDEYKFMTGGAPVTQEFSDDMGADGYGDNAISCVEKAKELIEIAKVASSG
ncbi:MAG TPA: corrinoid protein [Dehalococcoidia bacterium]|nr:corrinoid protein [Dehalococcoidia bacterium]MDP6273087.1 corrinoid protein [Dehalococcoidia bacterium]MDP7161268.1 corrinoid protein [Dehalococcoidia bacterium]MDP7213159.1 corrinoid protein [Dehalococcoidia bacterium]MDP7513599.1 corrinoid protein [Dehalococcoidia bacterium]